MTDGPVNGSVHVEVRHGAYADSVALLQVSRDVAAVEGVLAAQVAMATPLNVDVLTEMGFEVPDCSPNDMVVAIRLSDDDRLTDALAAVEAALRGGRPGPGTASQEDVPPRTTTSALGRSGASLVLVSVPGASATVEAVDALDADCDVMVFSDNVPLEQEVALKQAAGAGTAGDGTGLRHRDGRWRRARLRQRSLGRRGSDVGLVAASGTGCQQLMCLLSYAGVTVGAALGVGGRDLSAAVDGLSTREALRRLDADPGIDHIVVVSKPPDPAVGEAIDQLDRGTGHARPARSPGPGRP